MNRSSTLNSAFHSSGAGPARAARVALTAFVLLAAACRAGAKEGLGPTGVPATSAGTAPAALTAPIAAAAPAAPTVWRAEYYKISDG